MVKKYILSLILQLLVYNCLFSISPKKEYFQIRNYSNREIIINLEFVNSNSDISWIQEIEGIDIVVTNHLYNGNNIIKIKSIAEILSYYPINKNYETQPGLIYSYYDKLDKIEFMDKIKAIIGSFSVREINGNNIINNIDSLDNCRIKKIVDRNIFYILEIYD
jgi:hypothetical protein